MYHITKDKRTKKSAELIWQGMEKCLQRKSFKQLTITDIYQESYISRATFYRLFDSLRDVIIYQCDCIYNQLAININKNIFHSKQELYLYLIESWIKQETLINTLVENNMTYIIYETHLKNIDFMKQIFLDNIKVSSKEADYLIPLLAYIIPSAINTWYLHRKKDTPQEIYHFVSKGLEIISKQLLSK